MYDIHNCLAEAFAMHSNSILDSSPTKNCIALDKKISKQFTFMLNKESRAHLSSKTFDKNK